MVSISELCHLGVPTRYHRHSALALRPLPTTSIIRPYFPSLLYLILVVSDLYINWASSSYLKSIDTRFGYQELVMLECHARVLFPYLIPAT